MNTQLPFYILSAARSTCSDAENRGRMETLSAQLRARGLAVADCIGRYKGADEPSLLVLDETPSNSETQDAVMRLAGMYGQESVLAVDANRTAALIYCRNNSRTPLGIFQATSRAEAEQGDAWTERNGRYYICV